MYPNPTFRTSVSDQGTLSRANAVSRGTQSGESPSGWCCDLLLCRDGSHNCGITSDQHGFRLSRRTLDWRLSGQFVGGVLGTASSVVVSKPFFNVPGGSGSRISRPASM